MRHEITQDGVIVLGIPDLPKEDAEPAVSLNCGRIRIKFPLTFWHHLHICRGWGDRDCTDMDLCCLDNKLSVLARIIEAELWREYYSGSDVQNPDRLKEELLFLFSDDEVERILSR